MPIPEKSKSVNSTCSTTVEKTKRETLTYKTSGSIIKNKTNILVGCAIGLAVIITLTCIMCSAFGGPTGTWYNDERNLNYMTLYNGGDVGGFIKTRFNGNVGAATSDASWYREGDTIVVKYKDNGYELAERFTYGKDSKGNECLVGKDSSSIKYYRTETLAKE